LSQEKSEEVVGYIQCQHKMRRANTAKDKPETTMTRFFIASIAALLLATEATSAEQRKQSKTSLSMIVERIFQGAPIAAALLYGPTEEATHLAVLMLFVILANSKKLI
jgi:hypothetical protein